MEALEHLCIIWIGVFFAVYAARKTKLTPVLYFLFVGAVMVNTGLLPKEPDEFIRTFADIGIIAIMFAMGFEENTRNFLSGIRRSWGIALFGAVAPFAITYAVVDYFWGDTNMSLLCALAMTATAVSLTMVSLKGEGLQRSRAATGIMTSAVLDDIGALALVAVMVPLTTGAGQVSVAAIGWILVKVVLFFVLVVALGVLVFPHNKRGAVARIPLIGTLGVRQLFSFAKGEHNTLICLTIALSVGIVAHFMGFHPAIGAYMAGLVLKEEYFELADSPNAGMFEDMRHTLENIAFSWIGPVFFIVLGTQIVFDWDIFVAVIPQTAALTAGLFIVQTGSAALAARYTGAFNWGDSLMIGFGMLGRAELAFVVMDIAYVQHHIMTDEAFYTLMFTAFWLNVGVPVTIALWKPYYMGDRLFFGRSLKTEG